MWNTILIVVDLKLESKISVDSMKEILRMCSDAIIMIGIEDSSDNALIMTTNVT